MELCFATNNLHKLAEIQDLMGAEFRLLTLEDIGCFEDIPETQPTIAANSHQKAEYIWEHFGANAFADDTGLEVYALDNEPGVYSARYAGPQRDANDNIEHLWHRLAETGKTLPSPARFVTIITLVHRGKYYQFEGIMEGSIIAKKRGTNGFGYDPVFLPLGHSRTFAEMSREEKGQLSHRAKAFEKLVEFLKQSPLE
ncbi:RdgB/HAM1 family non-canonical purine NTP pyrophosphatase [Arundinibacter roseus]|uniref:dITP/XTP pyrophosphatase n=1 Tax=Arundinibacter roseus TaxID=2070510 RepID=A0A4R4KPF1_9BACT|nr:RdgB/HAM1 family non-canonical purine NTP pyrophosphatase [Arundinibacter roseus]TDB68776.1 RdgB/HAM1 family non-canonical purine NTP pyrophosphatase [Arundinibacter roseus]